MAPRGKFFGIVGSACRLIPHALAAAGLLICVGMASAQTLAPEAQDALQRGIAAARQKQWLVAQSNFENAFKLAPAAPEVLFNLALLNDGMGRELRAAAWYRAYLASVSAPEKRDEILARISAIEEQARSNARKLFERAVPANLLLPEGSRVYGLSRIISGQVRLGDVQAAFQTAASTTSVSTDPSSLAFNYSALVHACAPVGELSCVDQAISRIGNVDERMRALVGVVLSLPPSLLREAAAYASHVQGRHRVYAYLGLAEKQLRAGDKNAFEQSLTEATNLLEAQPKQENAPDLYTRLIKLLCDKGDIAAAQRLLSLKRVADDKTYLWRATAIIAGALVKANRIDEAASLVATIPDYSGPPQDAWLHPKSGMLELIDQARAKLIDELISSGRLDEVEALLAKAVGRLAFSRLSLAKAYLAAGNHTATARALDLAVTAAQKVEDIWKGSTLNSVAEVYAGLASSQLKSNLAAAKVSAAKAIKIAEQIKDDRYRGYALGSLSGELIFKTGLSSDVSRIALALSTNSEIALRNLIEAYTLAGQRSQAAALLAKIKDPSARSEFFAKSAVARAKDADWAVALQLAAGIEDFDKSRGAYAEIASLMLQAGLFKEAIALEPKFAGVSNDHSYLFYLSYNLARNGEFDAAIKAALRAPTPANRVSLLTAVASSAAELAGPQASLPMLEQVLAQIAKIENLTERSQALCSTSRQWVHWNAVDPDVIKPVAKQCADAIAKIVSPKDRASLMSNEAQFARHWFGAAVAESSDANKEFGPLTTLAGEMMKDGAIEAALALLQPLSIKSWAAYHHELAARSLAEAGDHATAQRLTQRFIEAVAQYPENERADGYSKAVDMLIASGNPHLATSLIERLAPSSRPYAVSRIIRLRSQKSERAQEGLAEQLANSLRGKADNESMYFLVSGLAVLGASEQVEAIAKNLTDPYRKRDAYEAMIRALLKRGETQKVPALLAALEMAIRSIPAGNRTAYLSVAASDYAWSGDTKRIEKLVADAPASWIKAQVLLHAADGFAKAGKTEAAMQALRQALEIARVNRPDFAEWAAIRIALAEHEVDPTRAAERVLALNDRPARTLALVRLSAARFAEERPVEAVQLADHLPRSPVADVVLVRAIRYLASKGDFDGARNRLSKLANPENRDHALRHIALIQLRAGNADGAIKDAGVLTDSVARAYLFLDIASLLGARKDSLRSQLIYAALDKLVDALTDPLAKADLLASAAENQKRFGLPNVEISKLRALEAAEAIIDEPIRKNMIRRALAIDTIQVAAEIGAIVSASPAAVVTAPATIDLEKIAGEERAFWVNYAQNTLRSELYASLPGYVEALSAKQAPDIVHGLADGAGDIGHQIREMRWHTEEWMKKRAAVQPR